MNGFFCVANAYRYDLSSALYRVLTRGTFLLIMAANSNTCRVNAGSLASRVRRLAAGHVSSGRGRPREFVLVSHLPLRQRASASRLPAG